jgi:hypothetical protein
MNYRQLSIFPLVFFLISISCMQTGQSLKPDSPGFTQNDSIWYRQPLRILQTVLREPDGKNYDAQSVVNYMKQTHSNVLVVNAGGIIDFFQNPLPAANPNRFFSGDDDVLRDIVKACHEEGFKVIARVDFRGVKKEIYEQHPDWFARNAEGNPITLTYTKIPLYIPCYDSYYRQEHALEFVEYLMKNYQVDGIWHNSVHVDGICHCSRCQSLYQEQNDSSLPVEGKSSMEEIDAYYSWKSTRAALHMQTIRKKIKEYGEDKAYAAEVFGMYDVSLPIRSGIDLYSARDHFDFLVSVNFLTENRREIEYKNLGYSASIIRFLKALDPSKQPVILFGQNGTSHRYIMEPDIDSRIFIWEALASGGSLWNCSFTGQHPGVTFDRRNAMLTADANQFIKEHGHIFQNLIPSSEVLIYYSKATRTHFGSDNHSIDHFGAAIQGVERMCRDNHLQYGFLPDENLSAQALDKAQVLFLPNVSCLSDREVEIIGGWVKNGGKLVSTFETSLYDEHGRQRNDFALKELFGCSFSGVRADTWSDCYQWINSHNSILTEKMQATNMLINGGETLLCNITSESSERICSYIPKIINQSPEMAWLPDEEMKTEHPTVLVNSIGKGKVIYFSNQPDRMNHLTGHSDYSDLMAGAVKHLLDDKTLIKTNAPSSVHIWVNESAEGESRKWVVSLVNHTGGAERPLRSLTPVHNLEVEIMLPEKMKLKSHWLRKEGKASIAQRGNRLLIKVDQLDEFTSVSFVEES